jgi:ribosome-associated toxin RatA of RatAB toxin-antitoxin module
MKSTKFSECIEIPGSAESIFDYTQDYNNRLAWDTFLTKAYLLNNATHPGKGVKAWCVAKNKLGMETEYISFIRPKVTAIKMTKGPYLFKDFAASWTFAQNDTAFTTVTFLYSYSLRFPYNVMTALVKIIFRKNVRKRLKDLKASFKDFSLTPKSV